VQTATLTYSRTAGAQQRDGLILEHLWLVRHIVGRLRTHLPAGADVENLEAAGVLGLVEAAQKYDAQRGVRFHTFAYGRVRGAIVDELRRNCPLPQHVLERLGRVRRAMKALPAGARLEAVADKAGLDLDETTDCLAALRLTRLVSMDGGDVEWKDRLKDADAEPEQIAQESERRRLLAQAIARLPEKERLVLTLYYMEDLRLKEIAAVMGLSESRVSRLLSAALQRVGIELRGQED